MVAETQARGVAAAASGRAASARQGQALVQASMGVHGRAALVCLPASLLAVCLLAGGCESTRADLACLPATLPFACLTSCLLVQASMGVLSEALEAITAAFLGRRKELEARASLQAKVASLACAPGVAAASRNRSSASLGPLQREASVRAVLGAGGASMRALASGSTAVAAAAAAAAGAAPPESPAGSSSGWIRGQPSPVRE
jgi:hypothetical protein